MIKFNVPPIVGGEVDYIKEAIEMKKLSGDGTFTKKCNEMIRKITGAKGALLTTSCTHALEMAAILCDIKPGDEVIMPSYTFVSTANAFVLRGATIVFVDIRPDTMNIDETLVEEAITDRTKAIVVVHYAGVGCEMDTIVEIARRHELLIVEDAAQAIGSFYNGRPLGAIGDFGALSFHETKNISCGEGGAFLSNNEKFIERAEVIREKGTNRTQFFRGEIDKYSWIDIGSSYLPSELNAAFLVAQLEKVEKINRDRMKSWNYYKEKLSALAIQEKIELPQIPDTCTHNAHMFWLKSMNLEERSRLIRCLKNNRIATVFHYVPLHSSKVGCEMGYFHGKDRYTTEESEKILRLPLYYGLTRDEQDKVIYNIFRFYGSRKELVYEY